MAVQREPLLGTLERDLDRPAGLAGQAGGDRLDVQERLGAERPAHRRADDPYALGVEPEDSGEVVAEVERRLRARPDLEQVCLPARHRGMRLHVHVLSRRRSIGLLDDHVCLLEPGFDVPVAQAEAVTDVRSVLRPDSEVGRVVLRRTLWLSCTRGATGRAGRDRIEDCR